MRRPVLASMLLSGAACGGVIHGVDESPEEPVPTLAAWTDAASTSTLAFSGRWWREFEDPDLDALVDQALSANLDLVAAFARVEQAKALRKSARSGYYPQIDGSANTSRARRNINFGAGTQSFEQANYGVSVSAAYEVDLWGRVGHAAKAGNRDFEASRFDAQTAAMSVASLVTQTYFDLVEQRVTLALLESQVRASETNLELLELRFDQGSATGLDVFQQRGQVASRLSAIPSVRARIETLENALSTLVARPPQSIAPERAALPEPPPYPSLGIPAGVLRQRPDVRAAELRLVAEDHRVGSAIAERYPQIVLSGSMGFNAFEITDLFQQFIWTLAASIAGPIFDGGRRQAEVDRRRGRLEELVAQYGSEILTALEEVENAVVNERQQVAEIEALDRQLAAARNTLAEARLRYANGLSDYLPVLAALTEAQQLERLVLIARRQRLAFRIQLHTALGGTWAEELEPARLSRAEPAPPEEDPS